MTTAFPLRQQEKREREREDKREASINLTFLHGRQQLNLGEADDANVASCRCLCLGSIYLLSVVG